MFQTFPDFIKCLENRGELLRIKEPVNPFLEVNRLARESLEKNGVMQKRRACCLSILICGLKWGLI